MTRRGRGAIGRAGDWAIAAALVGFWGWMVATIAADRGLFDWVGVDYALYAAGAKIVGSADPTAAYRIDDVARVIAPFATSYGAGAGGLKVGPLPYPAPSFFLYAPFATLTPVPGFVLWAAANLGLAWWVIRRRVGTIPGVGAPGALATMVLASFPVGYAVMVGQPVVVLMVAMDRAIAAWGRGRDYEGGLWLGVLLLKVQYPMVFVLVLVAKGRWRSLAGFATTAGLILLASLAAFGPSWPVDYLATVRSMAGFRDVQALIFPHQMINWRGFLVRSLPPGATESTGLALNAALSALTLLALIPIWRGPWRVDGPGFPARILATVLATMLVSFHNHVHGAILVVPPALALLARGGGPRLIPPLLRFGLFAPIALFALTRRVDLVVSSLLAAILAAYLVLLARSGELDREPSA